MPTIAELVSESRTVQIGPVTVDYNPQALTVARVEELAELDQSSVNVAHVRNVLGDLIVSWDLTDDDGTPLPPNAETLAKLPWAFLDLLATALITQLRPSRAEGNGSSPSTNEPPSAGSAATNQATSPPSSESSPPPAGRESSPGPSPDNPPPGSTGSG